MNEFRFHAIIEEDRTIRLPDGLEVALGPAEVVVFQPVGRVSRTESDPAPPANTTRWPLVERLAQAAQELGIDDLPPDLAENHDHYAHGLPKGTDRR